jgi:RimJ/RimL family protein N-acetyltransferase
VRPIGAGDKAALTGLFDHLGEQSRYQRFLTAISELSDSQLRYLTEVDHHDHEALLATAPDGSAVGVARFVRLDDPTLAEAAVAVVDEWQGRGLGTTLTQLLAERAREEGVERFAALLLAGNEQMHDVLASLGPSHVISREAGTVQIEVDIPAEGIGDHMSGVLRVAAGGTVDLATPPWGLRPAS